MSLRDVLSDSMTARGETESDAVYRKATLRIVPFLFVCYFFAFLDRVNVGFAKLHMLSALHFSEAIYGLGAGIFFLGYFLFEVPSNLIMHRIGARRWIARIMVTWGVISVAMAFVTTPTQFYIARFLLGLAEAGFFPGIILYLTYWYPAARRGRITTAFMAAIPMSGLLGSPLSGYILQSFSNVHGLQAWQWLFIIEALPSCILGVMLFFVLSDRPSEARWLTASEIRLLEGDLARDQAAHDAHSAKAAFLDRRVWLLAAIYFCIQMGVYGIGFWLPTLVKGAGISSDLTIGLVSAVPYLAAIAYMIVMGRVADATRKRRLVVLASAVLGSIGLAGSATIASDPIVSIIFLTFATMGTIAALALFWCLPSAFLGGFAAAGGLAIINSVGNLAGFLSPFMIGLIKDATQSTNPALYIIAAAVLLAAVLVRYVPAAMDR